MWLWGANPFLLLPRRVFSRQLDLLYIFPVSRVGLMVFLPSLRLWGSAVVANCVKRLWRRCKCIFMGGLEQTSSGGGVSVQGGL